MKVITAARILRRNLRHSRILEGDKQTDGLETCLFTEETIRSVKLSSVGFFYSHQKCVDCLYKCVISNISGLILLL